ncbi:MAG TPA: enolase C-terminal domain-like protein [Egibacteraceae bacterium]|nr:enolase C-terminal domain-like protein [Egibacteraceae bacterium]
MTIQITGVETADVRFPTSATHSGSDAMNPDPDYSAAYVTLHTDGDVEGHGLAFTIGRGNDVVTKAIEVIAEPLAGTGVDDLARQMPLILRALTQDSHIRWLGPEKGVMHLAAAAVLNAVWDLWAKQRGMPLWQLLLSLTPEELVACLDFRHVQDVLTPGEAVRMLAEGRLGHAERLAQLEEHGYPAYITSAGWLGYDDDTVRRLVKDSLDDGWRHFKLKVGGQLDDDLRRALFLRDLIGPDGRLMLDANQVWEVPEAIAAISVLSACDPYWIEEPTSPDDILGHAAIAQAIAPVRVATGEHVHNRVMFKQFLAAGAMAVCQADSCRLAGVNENIVVYLLAAKHGVPVCPHAGGVGLCEFVQHLSIFDYLSISGSLDGRMIEYVDHLHEMFVDPVKIRRGAYVVPTAPGFSTQMRADAVAEYRYPEGGAWAAR